MIVKISWTYYLSDNEIINYYMLLALTASQNSRFTNSKRKIIQMESKYVEIKNNHIREIIKISFHDKNSLFHLNIK